MYAEEGDGLSQGDSSSALAGRPGSGGAVDCVVTKVGTQMRLYLCNLSRVY